MTLAFPSTIWNERIIEMGVPFARLPDAGTKIGEWRDGQRAFEGGVVPVRDASHRIVGALFVRHQIASR
jgi:hypothetical protein